MDEFGIPDSWLMLELGEVIEYGKTEKSDPKDIPDEAWILELEDVEKDTSKLLQKLTFSERKSKSTKNKFLPGDVLYGKLRPYLNKVIIADEKGYCTTEIIPIRSNQAVDGQFLFYWLKHPIFLEYVEAVSHGINMPRLGTEAGLQAPFILAPLNEQKRIAQRLNLLLTRIDKAKAHLDRIPPLLKRFRQSVLAAATSGKLTEDWREANEKTEEFQYCSLASILNLDLGFAFKSAEFLDEGIRLLRGDNIEPGKLRWKDAKCFPPDKLEDFAHLMLHQGDVVLAMDRPIISSGLKIARVDKEDVPSVLVQRVCRFRPHAGLDINYLYLALSSSDFISHLGDQQTGTQIPHISGKQILAFEIALPLLEEQHEIVRRVEILFAKADRIETQYQTARQAIDRLTPALLAKAFRGELVPQDPNDEPASVLLERIKAEKEGREKKEKGGRSGRIKKS